MRFFRLYAATLAFLALTSSALHCSELAVLRNGFTIKHERHQQLDGVTRLYLKATAGDYVDVPQDEIVRFEPVEEVADPAPPPESGPQTATIALNDVIHSASARYNLDSDLVASLIHVESGFNPNAVSPKGAQGLMQLMPRTAAEMGVANPFDAIANVEGGTRYLRELLTRYNNNVVTALAAYNAGPDAVAQYHGVPPYFETRTYVNRIVREYNQRKAGRVRDRSSFPPGSQVAHATLKQIRTSPRLTDH